VLIFEDSDGDGRFDKRQVFIEKLNLVSGLEVGFGGVWVGAAPYLLFIPDQNRDDRPDGPPQVLLDGWAYQDTHETLNTFIWGPDGWLYGCHGVFTHSRVGKPGTEDAQRVPLNAGIWRYHPLRHEFEVFAEGTSNPWGVDFNDYGQAFATACVIPHLFHVIQGARYERQAGDHFNPHTYADIKTIADHRHYVGPNPHGGNNRSDSAGGGHAHSGAMIYLGGAWPEQYRNQIFMNNIHGQRINQDLLTPHGSGYVGGHGPDFLLTRDRWSQVLNLRYGPDGQVYLIDWYDANACHHGNPQGHDRSNGRIFKIVYQGGQTAAVDLAGMSDAELVELQLHANDWYVRHARRLLMERGPKPEVHAALTLLAREHPDPTRRLRGLWALHVTRGLTEELALAASRDENAYVRGWSVQLALETWGSAVPEAVRARWIELAGQDPSPVVRLYLASAAQRLEPEHRWRLLAPLLSHADDAGDHNLPLMYWYALEPLVAGDAARGLAAAIDSALPSLVELSARRVAAGGSPASLELLCQALGAADRAAQQQLILRAINTSLKGRRQVPMPKSWPAVGARLMQSPPEAGLVEPALALALTFGDPQAPAVLRRTLQDGQAPVASRRQALESLVGAKDAQLPPLLVALLSLAKPSPADVELRRPALRALAAYGDASIPGQVLAVYPGLSLEEKRDALNTLAARREGALALLRAVAARKVPAGDLSADLVRQLRNHQSAELDKLIADFWGTARDVNKDKAQLIAQYTKMLTTPPAEAPDLPLGRAMFAKTCQQCHTLFGTGGKVGPELTGSNRANLEYLLSNILDPSAVMAKEYQPSTIETSDGRVVTGVIKQQTDQVLTIQTANEVVLVPRDEVEKLTPSTQSMMPDDILKPLAEREVRSLVAYLASAAQTAQLATADTAPNLFNGRDLTLWQGDPALWKVEQGELVGRSTGLDHNEFLKSELLVGDFRLEFSVLLADNQGNSGVQFRSQVLPDGSVQGYQADIGPGWWGKLYEEHGRGLLWDRSGENHVQPGQWNAYVVEAQGSRIRTWINGQLCVDLDDPPGARQGIIALQLHSGGPMEVRFKGFRLEVPGAAPAVR
jgi:putative membrane-bound dehydrogenase-like protein